MTLLERFQRLVILDGECLVWSGHVWDNGLGKMKVNGQQCKAHRVAWELLNGKPLPKGLRLVRTCKTFECVRHWRVDKPWRRLTEDQVRTIRASDQPPQVLAERFGITARYVEMISCGAARPLRMEASHSS